MEQACYSGILVKTEGEPDRLSLVMVPAGTPEDRWEDPMVQHIFHAGEETRFSFPPEELHPGMNLVIGNNGIATRSLPPQSAAIFVIGRTN